MDLARRLSIERTDLRFMCRYALNQRALARRRRDVGRARRCDRLVVRCRRALRYIARITAEEVTPAPYCSHPLFSGAPEKHLQTPAPAVVSISDRRRTFRERLRRR